MTEEQKYQGALYKNKKAKTADVNPAPTQNNMAHRAYVEDAVDEGGWEDAMLEAPPRAPTPPLPDANDLDVFQFMNNPTPTASTIALPQGAGPSEAEPSEGNQLVRFEEPTGYDDVDAEMLADDEALVSYGMGPIAAGANGYATPLPKAAKGGKRSDKSAKKDKKRKRPTPMRDLDMTDAPVLHSDLTGSLEDMMRNRHGAFPPSPSYSGSGGENGETPASPLKKSRHSKHHRSSRHESGGIGNSLFSMLTSGASKSSKSNKRKHTSGTTSSKKRHSSHRHSKRLEGAKEPKLLGYTNDEAGETRNGSGAMVVYDQTADLFFSMVKKGPESGRGDSVNKVLKRFHRNRSDSQSKTLAEKELFKSLRMRRNDRGEIVLFCA